MLLLALDTASASVSVAVHDGTAVLASRASAPAPRHAELLAPLITEALTEAGVTVRDLSAVAVGVGPGPFTGLRVGLVTARMLGFSLGIPVTGVCSLDAVAAGAVADGVTGDLLVATDARRREVYWARYLVPAGGRDWHRLEGPHVAAPADVPRKDAAVAGRGGELYPDVLGPALPPADPPAAQIAALALRRAGAAPDGVPLLPPEPLYLRRPDAQEPGPRKRVGR